MRATVISNHFLVCGWLKACYIEQIYVVVLNVPYLLEYKPGLLIPSWLWRPDVKTRLASIQDWHLWKLTSASTNNWQYKKWLICIIVIFGRNSLLYLYGICVSVLWGNFWYFDGVLAFLQSKLYLWNNSFLLLCLTALYGQQQHNNDKPIYKGLKVCPFITVKAQLEYKSRFVQNILERPGQSGDVMDAIIHTKQFFKYKHATATTVDTAAWMYKRWSSEKYKQKTTKRAQDWHCTWGESVESWL